MSDLREDVARVIESKFVFRDDRIWLGGISDKAYDCADVAITAAEPHLRAKHRAELFKELIGELSAIEVCDPDTDPFYFRAGVWCDEHEDDSMKLSVVDWIKDHQAKENTNANED